MNRYGEYRYGRDWGSRGNGWVTPVIQSLLILNAIAFLVQMFAPAVLEPILALWPWGDNATRWPGLRLHDAPGFRPWQLLTYGFLHGSIPHILLNMFALWMFGIELERRWGGRPFLLYYLACVFGAGIAQLITTSLMGGLAVPTVGASGGVFGILLAFGLTFPDRPVVFIFLPVPVPAKIFVLIYGGIELLRGIANTGSGVAHLAHVGGMVTGGLLIWFIQRYRPGR